MAKPDPWATACAILRATGAELARRLAQAPCGPWQTLADLVDHLSELRLEAALQRGRRQMLEAHGTDTACHLVQAAVEKLERAAVTVAEGAEAHDAAA